MPQRYPQTAQEEQGFTSVGWPLHGKVLIGCITVGNSSCWHGPVVTKPDCAALCICRGALSQEGPLLSCIATSNVVMLLGKL